MLYAAKISCTVYGTGWGAVGRSVARGGARGSAPSPREGFFAIWTPLQLTFTRRPQQHADYRRACRDDRSPRSAREASGNLRPRGRVLRAARRAERRGAPPTAGRPRRRELRANALGPPADTTARVASKTQPRRADAPTRTPREYGCGRDGRKPGSSRCRHVRESPG